MNITELKPGMLIDGNLPKTTDEELQHEYNYILAENFTKKLLEKGLISEDEFDKITKKNQEIFAPLFAQI